MVVRYLRYSDLVERGLVNSRASLRNRVLKFGFPPGRLIGPNTRAWTETEIDAHMASRPVAPKPAPAASPTALPRRRHLANT
jgi:predicted DNA-binding transcriptional regulator AlpA